MRAMPHIPVIASLRVRHYLGLEMTYTASTGWTGSNTGDDTCVIMATRIVIADDSPFVREQFRAILEQRHPGWQVYEAANGEEAIRKCDQVHPDAVVLDLVMPEMDGLVAARLLHRRMPEVPLVMFGLTVPSEIRGAAHQNGVCAVFEKSDWGRLLTWLDNTTCSSTN